MYKHDPGLKLLLAHPGGPFWQNKDEGAWSIPKGVIGESGDEREAAVREFGEEIGSRPRGPSGHRLESNRFEPEWPPHSEVVQSFPEIDRAEFFDPGTAMININPAQRPLIKRLQSLLRHP